MNSDARTHSLRRTLLLFLFAVGGLHASAQSPSTQPTPVRHPSDDLVVSLLTMGHGDEVYEWFGHNALLIESRRTGASIAYNYGLFSFEEQNFILRFLQGRMWYWMEGFDGRRTVTEYAHANRSVLRQELNLTPTQRLALYNFLQWNEQPENTRYRYDYYTANCSTKVRDAIDRILDGQLKQQLEGVPTGHTYRWHTRRAGRLNPVMYTALYYVLGPYVDKPISAWEEGFLPEQLAQHLRQVTVTDAEGKQIPLVKNEAMLYTPTRPPLPPGPPNWIAPFALLGALIGGSLYGLARLTRRGKPFRILFALVSAPWLFLEAGMGFFTLGGWALTTHVSAYANENVMQFVPFALPLAVLAPMLAFSTRFRSTRWRRFAWWNAAAVLALSLLGFLLQALPMFNQVNGEMIAWMLPANLGLFLAIDSLVRQGGTIKTVEPQPAVAT